MSQDSNLYKSAGVDAHKGDELVEWLQSEGSTKKAIGGFAGLFPLDVKGYRDPQLVACTDGVGTKILLALEQNDLSCLGQDLVAMCVNDLYTTGAKPLFFLDYYATGILNEEQFKVVLGSIKKALKLCNCTLLGGETAELPGLYQHNHLDLAGFMVGVVDADHAFSAESVKEGDTIFAVPSSGFHSNGYSLLRKLIHDHQLFNDKALMQKLLNPTRIYSELELLQTANKKAGVRTIAHITGGGISGNLPRVLPNFTAAHIQKNKIKTHAWMKDFLKVTNVSFEQAESVFNIGIGLTVILDPERADEFIKIFSDAYQIGCVAKSTSREPEVIYVDG